MKKVLIMLSFILVAMLQVLGQVPQKFNYQAVVRNSDGTVMANQALSVQVQLHKVTANGDVVYSESHSLSTNPQGVINLVVGEGTVKSALFSSIPWSENIFIQIDIKKPADASYQTIGTTQILSVPYALSAGSVKQVVSDANSTDDAIFEVKNKDGKVVFGVYQGGVRVYVDDNPSVKGARGGFAVGGLTNQGKSSVSYQYLVISPDSSRIYINDLSKGARGGFAVGGLTNQGKSVNKNFFKVTQDSTYFSNTILTTADILTTGNISTGAGTSSGSQTDIDGNSYKTVQIGSQVWFKENLRTTHYSNGVAINPDSIVVINDDPSNTPIYGLLYAGNVLQTQSKNVCPDGWRLPSQNDWDSLFRYVGGPYYFQTPIITGLRLIEKGNTSDGTGYWVNKLNADNASGFSARPAGYAYRDTAWHSNSLGYYGYWWGRTLYQGGYVNLNSQQIDGYSGNINNGTTPMPSDAYSVRCVKGAEFLIPSKKK